MTRGRLLAVDDNPDNLVLLTGILQRAGYDVRAANSARRAIPMLEKEPPELFLLDVDMPETNGFDLCRDLKSRPSVAPVPVIFLTALDDVSDKLRGFEAGGVDYITKPFAEEEVLARVETQLRIFRLQSGLEQRNRELLAMNERLVREKNRTEEAFSVVSDLLPGRILDDAYEIGPRIGGGGFGVVYRGRDLRLERTVAIKVLRPSGDDRTRLARFKTEGIAACRVQHANAVEVYDSGFSQGVAYLVMEMLRGYSLSWLIEQPRPIPVARALSIASQICEALTAAHAARVIHRDITPGNVFLHQTPNGEIVKVVDFGIAKLVDDASPPILSGITAAGELIGTPEFMAPERLLGGTYDASTDIYSTGVILYRMLAGMSLFELPDRMDIPAAIRLHLTTKPRPLDAAVPGIRPDLAALVMEMVSIDPVSRPTPREVAARLHEIGG